MQISSNFRPQSGMHAQMTNQGESLCILNAVDLSLTLYPLCTHINGTEGALVGIITKDTLVKHIVVFQPIASSCYRAI